jgi:C-terminal processing protease CtpA/Prc
MFTDAITRENFKLNRAELKPSEPTQDTIRKKQDDEITPDWSDLRNGKERLTTQAGMLTDALVSKDGKTLYHLSKTIKNYDLWSTNLRTRESKIVLSLNLRSANMQWDKAQKSIFLLADGKIFKIDPLNAKKDTISTNIEITVDLAKERLGMFEHVWRRTAETFYTKGYHGANWLALKQTYQPYLSGIDNNYDFAEMLNELLGELNTSHTGASFNNNRKDATITASLGIFYDETYTGNGVRIKELIASGPLDYLGYDIKPGMIIESINGEIINKGKDIAQYLNGKQGKKVLIKINDGEKIRELTVKPVSPAEEMDLLYRRWVKINEEETIKKTNGEIGYVHLYRMNDAAYRNVYEEALGRFAKCKALIIDTRFNRGGDLAPELAMFLSGVRLRDNRSDSFLFSSEPLFRWTKPSIVLANEANYSDGHCFVYDYQYLHMGKMVGMPIPGSCTWMTGQSLQDNTLSFSVPTLGVKTMEGRYMENYQTEPDIKVMNEYGTVSKGLDQQLETAIKTLIDDLKKNK